MGENPPPGLVFEISFGPNLQALLAGELPPNAEPALEVPDFLPEEWGGLVDEEPPY
ncbi:MAG TPA: hypothetical protein VI409_15660 [Gaiellaceae bacterium]|nr:hypothetical protein [Gaiellaceae bacterium]